MAISIIHFIIISFLVLKDLPQNSPINIPNKCQIIPFRRSDIRQESFAMWLNEQLTTNLNYEIIPKPLSTGRTGTDDGHKIMTCVVTHLRGRLPTIPDFPQVSLFIIFQNIKRFSNGSCNEILNR